MSVSNPPPATSTGPTSIATAQNASRPETLTGLSAREAANRFASDGPNELGARHRHTLGATVLEVLREPMFLLLIAAGFLYLVVGELRDALFLSSAVLVVIMITVVQEWRTERALDALRDLSSPRALVLRDGKVQRIPGREVVVGDLLVVAEGDRIAADALLRSSTRLMVDESLLSGESMPVAKRVHPDADQIAQPGSEDPSSLFAGTLVSAGQGVAQVVRTGARTELGRIGASLARIGQQRTPLQIETGRMVRIFALIGLAASVMVAIAYALTRGGDFEAWHQGGLAGITMAMSALPEEFPVVLTVFLALGAWRMSRYKVLTRRMPVIEALGAATVLCVDKTGTLTHNRMSVEVLACKNGAAPAPLSEPLPENAQQLLQIAARACPAVPGDPMDRALHDAAASQRILVAHSGLTPVHEYGLSSELPAVTQLWRNPDHGALMAASKGAPETIARLCRMPEEQARQLDQQVSELAERGYRVLAVAHGRLDTQAPPATQLELELQYLGLVGFADPLRSEGPGALAECRGAGIRVIMITGDYPATARAIAAQAGLPEPLQLITGKQLAAMDDGELARLAGTTGIFARVVPEQKLRIVNALKANGEVVAMTGDGVNDAPALKAAHIGIAMGERGTDVAREAASLVLMDDAFASIVSAVRMGRRIYDNIRKAGIFIVAVHIPIIGLSMLPVLHPSWPLLLLPIHVAFLELVIDPSCSLVFEAQPGEPDLMRRPPRSQHSRLLPGGALLFGLMQGLSALLACVTVYLLAVNTHGPDAARALTFSALVTSLLALILINRSWQGSLRQTLLERNPALWWVMTGACVFLGVALFVEPVRRLFAFAPVHPDDLVPSLIAGVSCLAWFELLKRLLGPGHQGTSIR
ncbi:MAG: cation-translocating P-type ATPase [Quisquiliibacterium sp.]